MALVLEVLLASGVSGRTRTVMDTQSQPHTPNHPHPPTPLFKFISLLCQPTFPPSSLPSQAAGRARDSFLFALSVNTLHS